MGKVDSKLRETEENISIQPCEAVENASLAVKTSSSGNCNLGDNDDMSKYDGEEVHHLQDKPKDVDIQLPSPASGLNIVSSFALTDICGQDDENDYPFTILSADEIEHFMEMIIDEVKDVLQLDSTTVRILLNRYQWDKENLLETFYAAENADQVFENINTSGSSTITKSASHNNLVDAPDGSENCEICHLPKMDFVQISCGHYFCTSCWTEYLTHGILERSQAYLTCVAPNCETVLKDETVINLLAHNRDCEITDKFKQLITNGFVECNRHITRCPGTGCSNAIKVEWLDGNGRNVTCNCGHNFCFNCGQPNGHFPVDCDKLRKWLKKMKDDENTTEHVCLEKNEKRCPNASCKAAVVKEYGYNYMVCTKCQTAFCWGCMKLWDDTHDGCNRDVDYHSSTETSTIPCTGKDTDFTRYQFYLEQYKTQMTMLIEEEGRLLKETNDMVKVLMESLGLGSVEVDFLINAIEILKDCRTTLLNTYVFAYFAENCNAKIILEDNQRDLASATEKLAGYLERDLYSDGWNETRQKILDMSNYCAGRRKTLLRLHQVGRQNNCWRYREY